MRFPILFSALSCASVCQLPAVEPDEKSVIIEGISKSSVIAIGTPHSSATGGGGTTTGFRINEILRGKDILKDQRDIVVTYSYNVKLAARSLSAGTFIWFLQPQAGGKIFKEVTDQDQPFIRATPENIALVKNLLPHPK